MSVNIRAAEILPQNTEAPSQAGQAQAEGKSRQAMQNGALSQPGLLKLVALVEATFASQHTKFDAFLHLLHEYQASQIDKRQFEYQVSALASIGKVMYRLVHRLTAGVVLQQCCSGVVARRYVFGSLAAVLPYAWVIYLQCQQIAKALQAWVAHSPEKE